MVHKNTNIHRHVSQLDVDFAYTVADLFYPIYETYHRVIINGLEHLLDVPFIGIGNHGGASLTPECYVWIGKYFTLRRQPHLLTLIHDRAFDLYQCLCPPLLKMGLIKASVSNAIQALNAGYAIMIYPGGDREANRSFFNRNQINFYSHVGYIKTALRTGVPIIPIVSIGGHETLFVLTDGSWAAYLLGLKNLFKVHSLPLIYSFPRGWHIGLTFPVIPIPAQITLEILPPIYLNDYRPVDANRPEIVHSIDQFIRNKMQTSLDRLAKDRVPIIGKCK